MSDRPPLRTRLEVPLERVIELKDRTLAAFPVRVWRNFSYSNGFLLSAGMSYYVLFALFALLYVAFAGAGLWLGASEAAIGALVRLMNTYIPGLIGTGDDGLVSVEDVTQIAQSSSGVLGITGAIALGVALWTAVGAVTFTRRAVRDLFGLPFDTRSYWLLKARDFFSAIVFGGAMLLGAVLSWVGVWALEQFYHLLGWSTGSWIFDLSVRLLSIGVAFVLDAAALAMLVRFLTGTILRWRYIWPGALLGGGAMVVLQLGAGLLLSRVPGNPLLASFAVIIGLLLWCRWLAIVVLMAASFIAVTAMDHDQPLEREDETAAVRAEKEALVLAARVQLRRAEEGAESAPWFRRRAARRAVERAEAVLTEAEADLESGNVRPRT
ncbi:YihY/virulence factor BrkB family protein [Streptomyces sp. AC495_CC817]|uniref:YihY/virulence factor BrkB family protein n=1 Tax=Streptomyces sp. AC495_CC817 TaxID=2823900 RepID=UPI001C268198|nr:YihY/virulence factor BrkB family protein [Streptomyces sp. AC495_CC817]